MPRPTHPDQISRNDVRVTDAEITNIINERQLVASLRARLEDAQKVLLQDERQVMDKLRRGARVRTTRFDLTIHVPMLARRPEYKDLYLKHMEEAHGRDPKAMLIELKQGLGNRPGAPELVIEEKPKLNS